MDKVMIVQPEQDQYDAEKENIFIVLDRGGQYTGSVYLYPYIDVDKEPEHPHNIYLHMHGASAAGLPVSIKDLLLERALRRAVEIRNAWGGMKTRVYVSFLKHNLEAMTYFLDRGFQRDACMMILERKANHALPNAPIPGGILIRSWSMRTLADKQQFIDIHRQVFPRHPYSVGQLQAIQALPGWQNFSAFKGQQFAGNVMLYNQSDKDGTGIIEDMFVLREYRRHGLGSALLHRALEHFQETGTTRSQLEAWSANKPALQLYQSFGFIKVDETEIAAGRYI